MKPRMRGRRIGILMGGLSSERDQSLRTGEAVHAALVERGYDAVKVFVDSRPRPGAAGRAGRRRLPGAARPLRRGRLRPGPARALRHPLHRLVGAVVGAGDGQAQGQGALPPAQPADAALLRARARRGRAGRAARIVRFPVGGQAARRGLVARRAPRRRGRRAGDAVEEALRFDDHVLVERFVDGTEVHVAVLGGKPLGAVEIDRAGRLFDYARAPPGRPCRCTCRRGCRRSGCAAR